MISEKLMLRFMMATIHLLMIIAMSVCPRNKNYEDAKVYASKFLTEAEKEFPEAKKGKS